ncbi:MAG: peroxiredoxin family protein [Actinomycetota bacterium]
MRRSSAAYLLAVIALIAVLGACAGESTSVDPPARSNDGAAGETPGDSLKTAPDFSFETFEGTTFSLAEQKGTAVVLNFWESW